MLQFIKILLFSIFIIIISCSDNKEINVNDERWSNKVHNDFIEFQIPNEDVYNIDLTSIIHNKENSEDAFFSNFVGALGSNYRRVDFLIIDAKKSNITDYQIEAVLKNQAEIDTLGGELKLDLSLIHI